MKFQSSLPNHLQEHIFEMTWSYDSEKCTMAWNKLQLRETFVEGQIPPYRVEFDSLTQSGPFETGELNIHHGPFLSVHGAIGEISQNYRDLNYFFGSYLISFRLIRPVRLEFFRTDNTIKVRLTSYVKPWIKTFWNSSLYFFWRTFGVKF